MKMRGMHNSTDSNFNTFPKKLNIKEKGAQFKIREP